MFQSESTHMTTRMAAFEMGVTSTLILQHIASGNLKAQLYGGIYEIYRPDFQRFKERYQAGEFGRGSYAPEVEAERRANRQALELQRRFIEAGGKSK